MLLEFLCDAIPKYEGVLRFIVLAEIGKVMCCRHQPAEHRARICDLFSRCIYNFKRACNLSRLEEAEKR